jgi:hypothetical protein
MEESQNERAQKIVALLKTNNLTWPDYTILRLLALEPPRPAGDLSDNARLWAREFQHPRASVEHYTKRAQLLLARGLIQVVDEQAIESIRKKLAEDPAIEPAPWTLPSIGTMQLTWAGAELMGAFTHHLFGVRSRTCWTRNDVSQDHFQLIGPSLDNVLEALGEQLADEVSRAKINRLEGPVKCGPWRPNWWEKFDEGFVIDVYCSEPPIHPVPGSKSIMDP